jgi:4'-phosphopantetheinyl transferase
MNTYWLEQAEEDLPVEDDWLSARETARMESMRFAKRRMDWRLGRWTAKRALAVWLQVPAQPLVLAKIEVHPAPSGAPEAFLANKPVAATISLSHRAGRAMCAIAPPGVDLGCDLELIEPHSDAFVADYFTAEEQALVARATAQDRDRRLAMLWSAKESTLKALRTGLRVDTRCVIVSPAHVSVALNGWSPLQVRYTDGRVFRGWWQRTDNILRTLVADPSPESPTPLKIPAYCSDRAACCA